jgi:hypothetical protein
MLIAINTDWLQQLTFLIIELIFTDYPRCAEYKK